MCSGVPSVCAKTCGNGKLDVNENCDDSNETVSAIDVGCRRKALSIGTIVL